MGQYKISIILAAYNIEDYLADALRSLQNQTIGFENLEVIFVDDCSTDSTRGLLRNYSEQYPNVFVYSTEKNTGAAGEPRNIGLSHASAPYVMFLDPDDTYLPDACDFLYRKIENCSADIVGGTYRIITDGVVFPFGETPIETRLSYKLPDDIGALLRNRFPMWTKIFRREMIERNKIRFLSGVYGEDNAFLVACFTQANGCVFYSVPVYNYFTRATSVTYNDSEVFFKKNLQSFREYSKILQEHPNEAEWIRADLSGYFVRMCIEFEKLGCVELKKIFHDYREMFVVSGGDAQQRLVAELIREDRLSLAADYVLERRTDKVLTDKREKGLVWNVNRVAELEREVDEKEKSLQQVQSELKRLHDSSMNRIVKLERGMNEKEHTLQQVQSELQLVYNSDMYRLALKYYRVRDFLFPEGNWLTRLLKELFNRVKGTNITENTAVTPIKNQLARFRDYGKYKRMDVVTTPHTMYVAKLIRQQLAQLGIACEIHQSEPKEYLDIPYVIVCPQFVKNFPSVYVVVQMEQTISSRWFTKEYFTILENSCAILDYSLENVEFFHRPENINVRSRAYYLPIDYYSGYRTAHSGVEKQYDVLFYGDANSCERRRIVLEKLEKCYNLKICSEVFGEELYKEIEKAKVVVNIHYYEGALLETTRIYETLSLNTCVIVSERSNDPVEENRLEDVVDFVDINDFERMIERVGYWVSHDEEREKKINENTQLLEKRPNAFSFYFKRFLLAYDRIDFEQFYRYEKDFVTLDTNRICLTLPESTERRRSFDMDNKYGFQCFPGLRHEKGWVGCGLSYKFIFNKALEAGMQEIMICEDDVIFPENFAEKLDSIQKELYSQERWSIYSGVMADVGRVKLSKCIPDDKGYLLQINHMVSTVFNIYNREMFELFCNWDEQDRDVEKNAIDRYLESKELAVFVKVPFLVGHKEELNSTIWGFSNVQYTDLIEGCQQKLLDMAEEYEKNLDSSAY